MKMKYLFLIMLVASAAFVAAGHVAQNIVGTWKYTVSNVPPEYETGSMTFEEKDNKISGYLGDTDRANMKELTVADDKISFKLDFQGGELAINMVQKGDSLKGMVISNDGNFPITAVRATK